MNTKEKTEQSLQDIKDMMEKSTTFVSLSGMSGVISGIFAFMGVYILYSLFGALYFSEEMLNDVLRIEGIKSMLYFEFSLIFLLSILNAFILSYLKAKKKGLRIFNSSSKRFAFNLFLPVITAGFIIIALIIKEEFWMIIPTTLIFYGFALINAGKYSRPEVTELGIGCILSGILSVYYVEFSLILWGIGFGVLNIVTGITMYFKYDKEK